MLYFKIGHLAYALFDIDDVCANGCDGAVVGI